MVAVLKINVLQLLIVSYVTLRGCYASCVNLVILRVHFWVQTVFPFLKTTPVQFRDAVYVRPPIRLPVKNVMNYLN